MKEIHWTLSINCKEDRKKIEILEQRGRPIRVTTICGRPVCWEYELEGAYDRLTGEPVFITAFVGTGR